MTKFYLAGITLILLVLLRSYQSSHIQPPVTFIDPRTQLNWQFCSAGMHDTVAGCGGVANLYDWQKALQYCAQLDGDRWHLPSRNELIRLIDWQRRTPAVPDALRENTKNNVYWTSSSSVDEPDKAYYVSMFSGHSYPNKKILQGLVRCVRQSD
ncbi:MAG: DUF1566 domain-containing protein [Methylococcales bacterium]|nr:DUF1566 domain-containing protein [Methylococcales bacterium]